MKILQVIHDFLPNHQAGSELYCFHISQALRTMGHDVRLFYSEIDHKRPVYSIRDGVYEGLPFREIVNNHSYTRFAETYENPAVERVFSEYLDSFQPDVVHFHHLLGLSYGCARLCRDRGIPTVFTLHDYWLTCPRGGGQRFRGEGNICQTVEPSLCAECISRYTVGAWGTRLFKKVVLWFETKRNGNLLPCLRKGKIRTRQRNFISVGRCDIAGDCRDVLFAHPPSSIRIQYTIESDSELVFAVALHPDVYEKEGDGVRFSIHCDGESVYERILHPKQKKEDCGWHSACVSLARFAGRRCELIFETQAHPSGQIDYCTACWAEPHIIQRATRCYSPSASSRIQEIAQKILTGWQKRALIAKVERRAQKTRELFDRVDLFVAPSKFLRSKFIEYGLDPKKIVFSDYGICTEGYNASSLASKTPVRFTYIGTLVSHKGLHVSIEAFNRLPAESAILKVYGNTGEFTDYVDRIRALIAHPGISLCGRAENSDIPRILEQTDVLVVPSIWFENSPITIHEAFLAGVPVITSRFGGMADLVRDGENGLLFELGNAESLYRCLMKCVDNPAFLETIRPNPNEVKTLAADAEWMAETYKKLISAHRNP